jgi:hypothetical protein
MGHLVDLSCKHFEQTMHREGASPYRWLHHLLFRLA